MANTTWNPADLSSVTLTLGNLKATVTAALGGVRAVAFKSSGKFYWECTWAVNTNTIASGLSLGTASVSSPTVGSAQVKRLTGHIFVNNADTALTISSGAAVANGSVICAAVDLSAQLIWFRLGAAGNWNGSGTANPATGAGGVGIGSISTGPLYPMMAGSTSDAVTANFGDTAFAGAVPGGFTVGWPVSAAAAVQARVMVMA